MIRSVFERVDDRLLSQLMTSHNVDIAFKQSRSNKMSRNQGKSGSEIDLSKMEAIFEHIIDNPLPDAYFEHLVFPSEPATTVEDLCPVNPKNVMMDVRGPWAVQPFKKGNKTEYWPVALIRRLHLEFESFSNIRERVKKERNMNLSSSRPQHLDGEQSKSYDNLDVQMKSEEDTTMESIKNSRDLSSKRENHEENNGDGEKDLKIPSKTPTPITDATLASSLRARKRNGAARRIARYIGRTDFLMIEKGDNKIVDFETHVQHSDSIRLRMLFALGFAVVSRKFAAARAIALYLEKVTERLTGDVGHAWEEAMHMWQWELRVPVHAVLDSAKSIVEVLSPEANGQFSGDTCEAVDKLSAIHEIPVFQELLVDAKSNFKSKSAMSRTRINYNPPSILQESILRQKYFLDVIEFTNRQQQQQRDNAETEETSNNIANTNQFDSLPPYISSSKFYFEQPDVVVSASAANLTFLNSLPSPLPWHVPSPLFFSRYRRLLDHILTSNQIFSSFKAPLKSVLFIPDDVPIPSSLSSTKWTLPFLLSEADILQNIHPITPPLPLLRTHPRTNSCPVLLPPQVDPLAPSRLPPTFLLQNPSSSPPAAPTIVSAKRSSRLPLPSCEPSFPSQDTPEKLLLKTSADLISGGPLSFDFNNPATLPSPHAQLLAPAHVSSTAPLDVKAFLAWQNSVFFHMSSQMPSADDPFRLDLSLWPSGFKFSGRLDGASLGSRALLGANISSAADLAGQVVRVYLPMRFWSPACHQSARYENWVDGVVKLWYPRWRLCFLHLLSSPCPDPPSGYPSGVSSSLKCEPNVLADVVSFPDFKLAAHDIPSCSTSVTGRFWFDPLLHDVRIIPHAPKLNNGLNRDKYISRRTQSLLSNFSQIMQSDARHVLSPSANHSSPNKNFLAPPSQTTPFQESPHKISDSSFDPMDCLVDLKDESGVLKVINASLQYDANDKSASDLLAYKGGNFFPAEAQFANLLDIFSKDVRTKESSDSCSEDSVNRQLGLLEGLDDLSRLLLDGPWDHLDRLSRRGEACELCMVDLNLPGPKAAEDERRRKAHLRCACCERAYHASCLPVHRTEATEEATGWASGDAMAAEAVLFSRQVIRMTCFDEGDSGRRQVEAEDSEADDDCESEDEFVTCQEVSSKNKSNTSCDREEQTADEETNDLSADEEDDDDTLNAYRNVVTTLEKRFHSELQQSTVETPPTVVASASTRRPSRSHLLNPTPPVATHDSLVSPTIRIPIGLLAKLHDLDANCKHLFELNPTTPEQRKEVLNYLKRKWELLSIVEVFNTNNDNANSSGSNTKSLSRTVQVGVHTPIYSHPSAGRITLSCPDDLQASSSILRNHFVSQTPTPLVTLGLGRPLKIDRLIHGGAPASKKNDQWLCGFCEPCTLCWMPCSQPPLHDGLIFGELPDKHLLPIFSGVRGEQHVDVSWAQAQASALRALKSKRLPKARLGTPGGGVAGGDGLSHEDESDTDKDPNIGDHGEDETETEDSESSDEDDSFEDLAGNKFLNLFANTVKNLQPWVSCVSCGRCMHGACAPGLLTKLRVGDRWKCDFCRMCEGCGNVHDGPFGFIETPITDVVDEKGVSAARSNGVKGTAAAAFDALINEELNLKSNVEHVKKFQLAVIREIDELVNIETSFLTENKKEAVGAVDMAHKRCGKCLRHLSGCQYCPECTAPWSGDLAGEAKESIGCDACLMWIHKDCDARLKLLFELEGEDFDSSKVEFRCRTCASPIFARRAIRMIDKVCVWDRNTSFFTASLKGEDRQRYLRVIDRPLDLIEIRWLIQCGVLSTPESLIRTILCMLSNARTYNMPNTLPYLKTIQLERLIRFMSFTLFEIPPWRFEKLKLEIESPGFNIETIIGRKPQHWENVNWENREVPKDALSNRVHLPLVKGVGYHYKPEFIRAMVNSDNGKENTKCITTDDHDMGKESNSAVDRKMDVMDQEWRIAENKVRNFLTSARVSRIPNLLPQLILKKELNGTKHSHFTENNENGGEIQKQNDDQMQIETHSESTNHHQHHTEDIKVKKEEETPDSTDPMLEIAEMHYLLNKANYLAARTSVDRPVPTPDVSFYSMMDSAPSTALTASLEKDWTSAQFEYLKEPPLPQGLNILLANAIGGPSKGFLNTEGERRLPTRLVGDVLIESWKRKRLEKGEEGENDNEENGHSSQKRNALSTNRRNLKPYLNNDDDVHKGKNNENEDESDECEAIPDFDDYEKDFKIKTRRKVFSTNSLYDERNQRNFNNEEEENQQHISPQLNNSNNNNSNNSNGDSDSDETAAQNGSHKAKNKVSLDAPKSIFLRPLLPSNPISTDPSLPADCPVAKRPRLLADTRIYSQLEKIRNGDVFPLSAGVGSMMASTHSRSLLDSLIHTKPMMRALLRRNSSNDNLDKKHNTHANEDLPAWFLESTWKHDTFQFARRLGLQDAERTLEVRPSPIHGWGLFALRRYTQGEQVVEYTGGLASDEQADCQDATFVKEGDGRGSCYMFKLTGTDFVVDATRFGGVARFMNHSCDPSCVTKPVLDEEGSVHLVITAKKVIEAGDEITYDYQIEVEKEKIECSCGALNCVGRLN